MGELRLGCAALRDAAAAMRAATTYLFHDAGLALRKGNMSTRLVLDELDFNLSALAARLVRVVIAVILGLAGALNAAVRIALEGAIVAIGVVVDRGRRVLVVFGDFRGHSGRCWFGWLRVFGGIWEP